MAYQQHNKQGVNADLFDQSGMWTGTQQQAQDRFASLLNSSNRGGGLSAMGMPAFSYGNGARPANSGGATLGGTSDPGGSMQDWGGYQNLKAQAPGQTEAQPQAGYGAAGIPGTDGYVNPAAAATANEDNLSGFWDRSKVPPPSTVIGDTYKAWEGSQWKTDAANQQSIDSQMANLGKTTSGFGDILPGFGQTLTDFNAQNDLGAQNAQLQRIMGLNYDPNKSAAENFASIDRNANPELYNAAAGIGNVQAPTQAQTNWADQNRYGLTNRDQLATTQWNRFDQNADTMRNRAMPDAQKLQDKNWATDVINDQVWNAKGVNMATGDKNQIFNYSPEADRAREILGRRLSDGGGENLAYAYGSAQRLNQRGTGADTETAARDQLLRDMGRSARVGVGNVNLEVDREGKISDRELRDAQQGAREAFNDRGRVRGTGAAVAEIMASEDARRARRQENNQNNLNQANVGLANAQNQLQANIEQGRQNLSRMGQANQVLNDRFDQRLRADDSGNQRMLESIGAMSATDAQRQGNFMDGYNANMGFDADYQNRVDRYLNAEMAQGAYNTGQTNNWLNQLEGVNNRVQDVNRYNNDLAFRQDDAANRRLNEYMQASQDWNQRMMVDDAAAGQRANDYAAISSDWQGRQQQDFLNQLGQQQASYDAYAGLRQDPYGALGGIQGSRVDPNGLLGLGYDIGNRDYMGFSDYSNLTTGLINAEMGYDAQGKANSSSKNSAMIGAAGAIGGAAIVAI